ncbi:MAG: glycosyltransferase family 2 protein [Acidobacteriota bacterium]|nr:MAG: glycosyltransferase family 2 protein [Acidobacteriota bacterium]
MEALRRAVKSVRAQTYSHLEIILVADGPRATHVDALEKEMRDSRLRVVHLDKAQGPAAARNAGAETAQGEYLAFLDDDDEWLPEKLEVQMALAKANPDAALIFTDAYWVTGYAKKTFFKMMDFHGPATFEEICRRNFVASCSVAAVKTSAFEEARGFDASPDIVGLDDYDLWARLLLASHRAVYSARPLAVHYEHKESYSQTLPFLKSGVNFSAKLERLCRGRPDCAALVRKHAARPLLYAARFYLSLGQAAAAKECRKQYVALRPELMASYAALFHGEAYKLLREGKAREARRFLAFSMWHRPAYLKNYLYWAFSYLPLPAYQAARTLKRCLARRKEKKP